MIFKVLEEYDVKAEPEGDDPDATEFGIDDSRIYIVAEVCGNPIGSAILTETSNEVYKLSKLFLAKEYRRKGIGSLLLKEVVEQVRKRKGREIYLRTRDSYAKAIKLYEKSGWTRSAESLKPPGPTIKYSYSSGTYKEY